MKRRSRWTSIACAVAALWAVGCQEGTKQASKTEEPAETVAPAPAAAANQPGAYVRLPPVGETCGTGASGKVQCLPCLRADCLRPQGWKLLRYVANQFPLKEPAWTELDGPVENSGPNAVATPVELADAPPKWDIFEATFFNQTAQAHMNSLMKATTKGMMSEGLRDVPPFPRESLIVKTFWRAIPMNGKTFIGVWDWKLADFQALPPGLPQLTEDKWPTRECVEANPAAGSECLDAAQNFVTATSGSFSTVCMMGKCSPMQPGQTMILIAMHVASKELPDWLWATYWWKGGKKVSRTKGPAWTCDDDTTKTLTAADFPASSGGGAWLNYSMNLTSSIKVKRGPNPPPGNTCGWPKKIDGDEELRATFNPLVEGVVIRGMKSNCIDCHGRASTNKTATRGFIPDPGSNVKDYPGLLNWQGHLRTDYLWSPWRKLDQTLAP